MRPAIHPGEILSDELNELGVTPTALSRQINVPPNRVTQIIHGRRSVTGDTALRLGRWFGSSARFWLNLQSAYDIRIAEERVGQEIERLPRRPAAIADVPLATLASVFKAPRKAKSTAKAAEKAAKKAAVKKALAKAAAKRPAAAKKRA